MLIGVSSASSKNLVVITDSTCVRSGPDVVLDLPGSEFITKGRQVIQFNHCLFPLRKELGVFLEFAGELLLLAFASAAVCHVN